MDTALGMASTPHNNTEDLVESSPSGTQVAPVDDDVQIGGAPRAIEERNYKKRKSNDGDDQ